MSASTKARAHVRQYKCYLRNLAPGKASKKREHMYKPHLTNLRADINARGISKTLPMPMNFMDDDEVYF
jgi:hypothetical protein